MNATDLEILDNHRFKIQFEDGTIVITPYSSFMNGCSRNPSIERKSTCIGKSRVMNCGMNATIIEYINKDQYKIRFDDGTEVLCKRVNFDRGLVANPTLGRGYTKKGKSLVRRIKDNRIGESKVMHCGLKATVIAYRNSRDIDVEFEDGTIRTHVYYCNFQRCRLSNGK